MFSQMYVLLAASETADSLQYIQPSEGGESKIKIGIPVATGML